MTEFGKIYCNILSSVVWFGLFDAMTVVLHMDFKMSINFKVKGYGVEFNPSMDLTCNHFLILLNFMKHGFSCVAFANILTNYYSFFDW